MNGAYSVPLKIASAGVSSKATILSLRASYLDLALQMVTPTLKAVIDGGGVREDISPVQIPGSQVAIIGRPLIFTLRVVNEAGQDIEATTEHGINLYGKSAETD